VVFPWRKEKVDRSKGGMKQKNTFYAYGEDGRLEGEASRGRGDGVREGTAIVRRGKLIEKRRGKSLCFNGSAAGEKEEVLEKGVQEQRQSNTFSIKKDNKGWGRVLRGRLTGHGS